MSIKTDCQNLDIAFYTWAAERLTHFIEHGLGMVQGRSRTHSKAEWADILTEMRDAFREAADSNETVWSLPSPRLSKALKTWALEINHLWT